MAILSTTELNRHARTAVTNRNFEAALLNSSRIYSTETAYDVLIQDEVSLGAGGYSRIDFTFSDSDIVTTATGTNTVSRYLTWFHDGTADPYTFDHIMVVERIFAQPLPEYYVVGIYDLGISYTLQLYGERARFALRFNIKNR